MARLNAQTADSLPFVVAHPVMAELPRRVVEKLEQSIFSTTQVRYMPLSLSDAPTSVVSGSVMLRPLSDTSTEVSVKRLASGHVAFSPSFNKLLKTRHGDQTGDIEPSHFEQNLRRLPPHLALHPPDNDWHIVDACDSSIPFTPLPPEDECLEYKNPQFDYVGTSELCKDYVLPYLTCAALNAAASTNRPFILKIGVDDTTRLPIGFRIHKLFFRSPSDVSAALATVFRPSLEDIFPLVSFSWFQWTATSVLGSIPSDWPAAEQRWYLSIEASSSAKKACAFWLRSLTLLCGGQATYDEPDSTEDSSKYHAALLLPESSRCQLIAAILTHPQLLSPLVALEIHVKDQSELSVDWQTVGIPNFVATLQGEVSFSWGKPPDDLPSFQRRVIFEAKITVPVGFGAVFSLATTDTFLPPDIIHSMSSFSVWLALRDQSLSFGAASFLSAIHRQHLILPADCDPAKEVTQISAKVASLLGHPSFSFQRVWRIGDDLPTFAPTSSVTFTILMDERVNFDSKPLRAFLGTEPRVLALYSVPPSLLQLKSLLSHLAQCDGRLLDVHQRGGSICPSSVATHHSSAPAIKTATRPYASSDLPGAFTFDYVFEAQGPSSMNALAWLSRRDLRPPAWDLMGTAVLVTKQARALSDKITSLFSESNACGALQVALIASSIPGSGATALLRSVGWLHRTNTLVLWIQEVTSTDAELQTAHWKRELSAAVSKHVLVLVDSSIKYRSLLRPLQDVAASMKRSVVLLSVTNDPTKKLGVLAEVSPLLELDEVADHVLRLKDVVTDESAKRALETLQKSALSKDPPPFSNHIFVFALAAFNGVFQPVSDWIQTIYKQLQHTRQIDVITAIAFVSAFSPTNPFLHQLVPSYIELGDPNGAFLELFGVKVAYGNGYRSYYCLHPFLARIFLQQCEPRLDWSTFIPMDILSRLWQRFVTTIRRSAYPEDYKRVLISLLSLRTQGGRFSLLMSQIVLNPSCSLDAVADFLTPEFQGWMGAHGDILYSRLCRARADRTIKPNSTFAAGNADWWKALRADEKSVLSPGLTTSHQPTSTPVPR